jgi:VWFA-related protein
MTKWFIFIMIAGFFSGWTQEDEVIRADVSLVSVDVAVTEKSGKPVLGLKAEDFVVLDGGQPVTIKYFEQEKSNLALVLLLDVSGSTGKYLNPMAKGAAAALGYLKAGDRVALMAFGKQTVIKEELTDQLGLIKSGMARVADDDQAGGQTNINAAILFASKYLEETTATETKLRRVILILTDNIGVHYQNPDGPIKEHLQKAGIVLESLIVGKEQPLKNGSSAANNDFTFADVIGISEASGGSALRTKDVAADFAKISERIRGRYLLQFQPASTSAGFRPITVTLRENGSKRQVRARTGYFQ